MFLFPPLGGGILFKLLLRPSHVDRNGIALHHANCAVLRARHADAHTVEPPVDAVGAAGTTLVDTVAAAVVVVGRSHGAMQQRR